MKASHAVRGPGPTAKRDVEAGESQPFGLPLLFTQVPFRFPHRSMVWVPGLYLVPGLSRVALQDGFRKDVVSGPAGTISFFGEYGQPFMEIRSHSAIAGESSLMDDDTPPYVHGRSGREAERLRYQATGLAGFLHRGVRYPPGARVLEAACGVGAQTVILAGNSPGADFTAVDISPESLGLAEARVRDAGFANVSFRQADVFRLPFPPASFDHVFVCFLLEHLRDPVLALRRLSDVLRPGGTITVIEGDHGSAFFHPDTPESRAVIRSLVDLQAGIGGNALIGRELAHLLPAAGFSQVAVTPVGVYADEHTPGSFEAVRNIFIAMIEGVRTGAIGSGIIGEKAWDKGIADLYRTASPGGSFSYTFFRATGVKEG